MLNLMSDMYGIKPGCRPFRAQLTALKFTGRCPVLMI